jgi:hypothetical protein
VRLCYNTQCASIAREESSLAWYSYLIIVLAGVAAGFINVLAGNGSLITLPALIFIGLPANVANATNRIGVLFQNVVGTAGFHRQGKLDVRGALLLSVPMVLGSALGARIAVDIDETFFRSVLACVMIVMLILMLIKPERWVTGKAEAVGTQLTPLRFLVFFAIGIYGGFLQAGVGIFLLVGLVLEVGYDIVRANAAKVLMILASAVVSLLVFSVNLEIAWSIGLVLAAGNMLGAWLATRFAIDKGAVWVRRFVIVIVLVSAAQLLGVFDLLGHLLA